MTPLQQKINLIRQYIYDRKGVDIGETQWKEGDNSRELAMLDQAYAHAVKYYTQKL